MPVVLRPREDRRLRAGHLWVFSNEIARVDGDHAPGDVVEVRTSDGRPIGSGMYSPHSLITVRMIGGAGDVVDGTWFHDRIAAAIRLRARLFPRSSAYRLLHAESDAVPGVVVDRYGETCVVQISSIGMEMRRELLFDALMAIDGVTGVVERNDTPLRALEGLDQRIGIARGTTDAQTIDDGFVRYRVDPLGGQKTGFFLDQRENRPALRRYMVAANVLDLFCNSGGFALHARACGGARVVGIDSSQNALLEAERNAELNGLGDIEFRRGDVFEVLTELQTREERFDVVVADPPPFARSKKHVSSARRKYVDLFARSLGLVRSEGVAFLATCSHHITQETFAEIVRESLSRAKRRGVILEERGASPDHPVHPMMPETRYLHGVVLRVVDPP